MKLAGSPFPQRPVSSSPEPPLQILWTHRPRGLYTECSQQSQSQNRDLLRQPVSLEPGGLADLCEVRKMGEDNGVCELSAKTER